MLILNGELKEVEDSDIINGEIKIPDGVTSIGKKAFYKSSLTSVIIPDSVTSIGDGAFYSCSSLTSVTIPGSVTSIGAGAFYSCRSLTSIIIPDSVTLIGDEAFSTCSSLTSIIIPDSVTSIGRFAFNCCDSLTSIIIPESVTFIGDDAFRCYTKVSAIHIRATTKKDYDRILSMLPEGIQQRIQNQLREAYEFLLERIRPLLADTKDSIGFFNKGKIPFELTTKIIGNLAEQYNIPKFMADSVAEKFNNNSQSMDDKPEHNDVIQYLPM